MQRGRRHVATAPNVTSAPEPTPQFSFTRPAACSALRQRRPPTEIRRVLRICLPQHRYSFARCDQLSDVGGPRLHRIGHLRRPVDVFICRVHVTTGAWSMASRAMCGATFRRAKPLAVMSHAVPKEVRDPQPLAHHGLQLLAPPSDTRATTPCFWCGPSTRLASAGNVTELFLWSGCPWRCPQPCLGLNGLPSHPLHRAAALAREDQQLDEPVE